MSQCPQCQQPVAAKDERCPHCGAAVAVAAPANAGSLESSVLALMRQGEKFQAVKLYREQTGVGLAEAKAAVESIERGDTVPTSPSLDGNLERQILEMMATGRKIEAIKLFRAQTNSGLKESKDAVEELAASRGSAPIKTGCLGAAALMLSCLVAVALCVCLTIVGTLCRITV